MKYFYIHETIVPSPLYVVTYSCSWVFIIWT